MACATCGGGRSTVKNNPIRANINPMENYIIDENYDVSNLKKSDLENNVFTINPLSSGFEIKSNGTIEVNLIYRRNAMQDSVVTSRSLLTAKRQIDSKFGNKSNTRKLIAVPVKKEVAAPEKSAKKVKPKLDTDAGSNTSTKVSPKTGRKSRKNQ